MINGEVVFFSSASVTLLCVVSLAAGETLVISDGNSREEFYIDPDLIDQDALRRIIEEQRREQSARDPKLLIGARYDDGLAAAFVRVTNRRSIGILHDNWLRKETELIIFFSSAA